MIEIQGTPESNVFGKAEERSIISLLFDEPDFMAPILPYLNIEYFDQPATKYVFAIIKYHYDKHNVIISRPMCLDIATKDLTADDPIDTILSCIKRETDPRELPIIMDKLIEWTKKKAYNKIYSKEALEAHERGEYEHIDNIIEEARRITDSRGKFYSFFKEIPLLFRKDDSIHLTSGFPTLDQCLNLGGPTRGDVLCFMAATGVGKSITLCNAGAANIRKGLNVLHVTLELSVDKTAERYMGCFSNVWIKRKFEERDKITQRLMKEANTYKSHLLIKDYPPDDVTIDVVHANIDTLRRIHGIQIDVVIIDYLELLLSRTKEYNDNDYNRQKHVSTELLRLAKKENVLVITAIQTNREGTDNLNSTKDDKVTEMNKVAESYGKLMPVDYLCTINQTKQEYEDGKEPNKDGTISENSPNTHAICRLYIAKNRNGPKFRIIYAEINYETMIMKEFIK